MPYSPTASHPIPLQDQRPTYVAADLATVPLDSANPRAAHLIHMPGLCALHPQDQRPTYVAADLATVPLDSANPRAAHLIHMPGLCALHPQDQRPTYVAADLATVPLAEALGGAGFDPHQPTLFTVEGLIYYLPEVGNEWVHHQAKPVCCALPCPSSLFPLLPSSPRPPSRLCCPPSRSWPLLAPALNPCKAP